MALGYGKLNLIREIIRQNWGESKTNFVEKEVLYILQEALAQEGKPYFEDDTSNYGYNNFRFFARHLLYRNCANFDSMVLITAEKGCLTKDTLIEMPRDLIKYPKGIPISELIGKTDFFVYSFNIETKRIEVKKAKSCEWAKYADVYELELKDGRTIKATGDHPFLLMTGEYKQLKDLFWIDKITQNGEHEHNRVMINNKFEYTDRLRVFFRPDNIVDNDFIKIDYSKIDKRFTCYKHTMMEHRFVAEQLYGDITNKYVHHKDGNHKNHTPENLEAINWEEHFSKHNMDNFHFKKGNDVWKKKIGIRFKKGLPKIRNGTEEFSKACSEKRIAYFKNPLNKEHLLSIKGERRMGLRLRSLNQNGGVIKSIKYLGKEDVYDIVGVEDNKNFIANGFIVSNTGKSSAGIMLCREWCRLLGIQFNPKKHIAYSNADVQNKIETLPNFSPLLIDEAVKFASSAEWNKAENKELKKKLAVVRAKHLLFVLCFPLKVNKLEKNYLDSFVTYWVDLISRGNGVIFVKDKNPTEDSWRMRDFERVGSYTEFTDISKVKEMLKKHPNFWTMIRFPKPPDWLYKKYLEVREKNIYDDDNVLKSVNKEDIYRALAIISLRDIMLQDSSININRILLHIKNTYDVNIPKQALQSIIEDAKQLVVKVREGAITL